MKDEPLKVGDRVRVNDAYDGFYQDFDRHTLPVGTVTAFNKSYNSYCIHFPGWTAGHSGSEGVPTPQYAHLQHEQPKSFWNISGRYLTKVEGGQEMATTLPNALKTLRDKVQGTDKVTLILQKYNLEDSAGEVTTHGVEAMNDRFWEANRDAIAQDLMDAEAEAEAPAEGADRDDEQPGK